MLQHREAVHQNEKDHIAVEYYKQFYDTLVLDKDQLDRCKVQELQAIPASDFF